MDWTIGRSPEDGAPPGYFEPIMVECHECGDEVPDTVAVLHPWYWNRWYCLGCWAALAEDE